MTEFLSVQSRLKTPCITWATASPPSVQDQAAIRLSSPHDRFPDPGQAAQRFQSRRNYNHVIGDSLASLRSLLLYRV
jgi:hypothetical protein